MPRASCITPALAREVAQRRQAGEAWKTLLADLRKRGLPAGRTVWHHALRDVREHRSIGQEAAGQCSEG
jgi:hypothetical protein